MAEQFYNRLQGTASRLLNRFRQGAIAYRQPGTTTGPAFDPVVGPPTNYELDATAVGVSQKYINGTTIVAADKEVTAAVFGATPDTSGRIVMDGRELEIVQTWQVPASGTPVAHKFIVKA